ncbi:MAG: hypothetical protein FHOMOCKG_00057 [Methanophagales virus GBV302]|uniref:Terminase large subunit gp17-like C-terminal domain-containing protein n=1 Tax=Methanophagales virus GBV302 TaxID=2999281 RepID=A0A9E8VD52_9CAUD|nr:MAG: hypothetical protein QIT37_gp057 [Methanophagales virus GBV302]WAE39585.1 MAG: hypothetical protein FHOMOCKG_00057 [Methanophagales virus GBV302]
MNKKQVIKVICDYCGKEYEVTEQVYYAKMRQGFRYFFCSEQCLARARAEYLWNRKAPVNIPDELKEEPEVEVSLIPEDMQGFCYYCHRRIPKSAIFCEEHATKEHLAIFEATQELPVHPRGWWSYEIIKDWLSGYKKILLKAPSGTGKSVLEDIMAYLNLTLFDNSFTLIGSISMPIAVQHIDRIRGWVAMSPFRNFIVYDSKEQIKLKNGSRVLAIAQNEKTRGGYHPDLILLDELARIRPSAYYGLFYQMGKTKGATEIGVSTPFLNSGAFLKLWHSGTSRNYSVKLEDCWFITEEMIRDAQKDMSPSFFDQVFKAEFVATSNRVIPDEQLLNAITDTRSKYTGETIMGLDFGRKRDHTALVVLNDKGHVIYTEILPLKTTWREQYAIIRDRAKKFNPTTIYADQTSIGDPILEELSDLPIEPVLMSNDKLKKKIIDNLVLCFAYNSIHIPKDEQKLIDQLSAFVYLDDNLSKCGPEGGAHDDLVDALALASLGLERHIDEEETTDIWGAIGGERSLDMEESPWTIVW